MSKKNLIPKDKVKELLDDLSKQFITDDLVINRNEIQEYITNFLKNNGCMEYLENKGYSQNDKDKTIKKILKDFDEIHFGHIRDGLLIDLEENFIKQSFNFKKSDIQRHAKECLTNKGCSEEIINNKSISLLKKVEDMQFKHVLKNIKNVLEGLNTKFDMDKYDGILVKYLGPNNTRGSGDQTHIELTESEMDIFPYLQSYAYSNNYKLNERLKSYFTLKIDLDLDLDNIIYLIENTRSYDETRNETTKNESINSINFFENEYVSKYINSNDDTHIKISTHSTAIQGFKDQSVHGEISQISFSGKCFEHFRWILPKESYLIILKLKKELKYEIYGILPNDTTKITQFKGYFGYYQTRKNKTLISLDKFDNRVEGGKNVLLYGVPGSGKSWHINNIICEGVEEECMERVVFHPDYTYSDFIGQILPKISKEHEGQITYEFVCGPFTSILRKAHKNPHQMFYLIIEEINRGNAPAIFGDIFQLLDRMEEDKYDFKKGTSEFSVTNADIADKVYGDENKKVRIPSNLYIIATMNTSDQNVFTLDTAFQRRWDMEMIKNNWDDEKVKFKIKGTNMDWSVFGKGMNELIIKENKHGLSSEDKRLGAYFIKKEDFDENMSESESKKLFAEKVLKYLWDDAFKFDRGDVFEEEKGQPFTLEFFIDKFTDDKTEDSFSIFTNEARSYIGLKDKTNQGLDDAE